MRLGGKRGEKRFPAVTRRRQRLFTGAEGLRINSVIPGPIAGTEGMARLAPDAASTARVIKGVPLGRMGTPRDVANACLFLGSEAASYVTGAVMTADGGWAQTGAPLDFAAL